MLYGNKTILMMSRHKCLMLFLLFILVSVPLSIVWYQSNTICIKNPNKRYTHIIGAGTAGCVLAARLSENENNNVLLIEAGGHFNIFSKIPVVATLLQKSAYDWSYETVAQKWSSEGFLQKKQSVPRGKGLGGTGQMNFMIADTNYQSIENSLNMWESINALDIRKNIVEVFERLKIFEALKLFKACNYQKYLFFPSKQNKSSCKVKTKIKTTYPVYLQRTESRLEHIYEKAIQELQNDQLQYQPCTSTVHKGLRWSTYDSHLRPASKRHNLHVLCHTEVRKITFKNKRAVGIHAADKDHNKYTIYATSEIILCAGAINTPKLLLLSGVGNSSELQELNIPVTADLPGVGLNLHDHFNMPIFVSINESISLTLDKILSLREVFKYVFYRKGVLAASPIAGIAHIPSNLSLILFAMGSTDESIFCAIANYFPLTFRSIFPLYNNPSQEGLVFLASCAKPRSRGFVKMNSKDTTAVPLIDPQYLQNKYDVCCMKTAVKLVAAVVETQAFKNIGATVHWPQIRNCQHYQVDFTNDNYLECIIRTAGITGYHHAGTCKMGVADDVYSVVDQKFRIRGTTGLRVIDASILPTPASIFPNVLLIALAEYAIEVL